MPTKAVPTGLSVRDVAEIQADLQSILKELSLDFFERSEDLVAMFIAILSRQHGFLLGDPGTAKSDMTRSFCGRFDGAEYWEILMDRQLGKEESFGPIDLARYDKGDGKWVRDIEGTLATCHIAFVDEVGKAGPASLNPYLTAFNERTFKSNGKPERIPLISAMGASNEMLEPELAAMWDRFLVRRRVNRIVEPGNFLALLDKATPQRGAPPKVETTITLAELEYVTREEVPYVQVPTGIKKAMGELRATLEANGVIPSDRRWYQGVRLVQASAFLNGNDIVDDDDLAILKDVMWDTEAQISDVTTTVLSLTSPTMAAALEMEGDLAAIKKGVTDRMGLERTERTDYGAEAQYKLNEIVTTLNQKVEEANREGRSTLRLEKIRGQVRATRTLVFEHCMNMSATAAEAAATATDAQIK